MRAPPLTLCLLALSLAACGGEAAPDPAPSGGAPEKPAASPVPARPTSVAGWRLDCHALEIPDRPARGAANGRPFELEYARLQNGILTLTDGDLFEWSAQFIVFLFTDEGEDLAGRRFAFAPERSFSAEPCHVHFHHVTEGTDREMDSKVDGFSLRLEFGERDRDRLPGRIYLSYPDAARSHVAGTFFATVE